MTIYLVEQSYNGGIDWEPMKLRGGSFAVFEFDSVARSVARQNSYSPVHADTKFRVTPLETT